jgi:hypothetical protein
MTDHCHLKSTGDSDFQGSVKKRTPLVLFEYGFGSGKRVSVNLNFIYLFDSVFDFHSQSQGRGQKIGNLGAVVLIGK